MIGPRIVNVWATVSSLAQPPCWLEEADGEETALEIVALVDVVFKSEGDAVESPPSCVCQSVVTTYLFEKTQSLPGFRGPVVVFAASTVVASPRLQKAAKTLAACVASGRER